MSENMSSKDEQDDKMSFSDGPQECHETVCEPCSESGSLLKADGYCVKCNAFLCQACIQYHKRLKLLKDHKILGPDEMPRTKLSCEEEQGRLSSMDLLTAECKLHKSEIIEFYCKDHKTVLCAVCVTLSHKSCANIQPVVDVSKEEGVKNELESFTQRLNDASERLCTIHQTAENNHSNVKERKEKLLSDICMYKENAIETIKRLATTLETSVEKMTLENQVQIDQRIKHCTTLQKHTDIMSRELKDLQDNDLKAREFIFLNQSEHQLEILEENICEMYANTLFKKYSFCANIQLRSALTKTKEFGQLVGETETGKCDICKMTDRTAQLSNLFCGHTICRACINGSIMDGVTCNICGKVSVECKSCQTNVDKSSVTSLACSHEVCLSCRKTQTKNEAPCKECGLITGDQPDGSIHEFHKSDWNTIRVEFNFPDGIQMPFHPCPGKTYKGMTLVCFLPDDDEGKKICGMLKTAFNQKLISKIEHDQVRANIQLCDSIAQVSYRGYPKRLTTRLRKLGITA